jgi:hypothetical protein
VDGALTTSEFGQGSLSSDEGEWRGIAWNVLEDKLFGLTSVGKLYSISTVDGQRTLVTQLNTTGEVQDLTFDFSGVAFVASFDNNTNKIFSFSVDYDEPADSYAHTWLVHLHYITPVVTSIAFDTNDYSMYLIDSTNNLYIMRPSTLAENYCVDPTVNALLIAPAGLAVSVSGDLFSGWEMTNLSEEKTGFGLMTNLLYDDCAYQQTQFLREVSESTFTVEYTMFERCGAPFVPPVNAEVHTSNAVPAFPGDSNATILTGWASTGVMTLIGAGLVGLCGLFAITVALNTSKDETQVPLAVALEGAEESVISHDNALHVASVGALNNNLYT